MSQRFRDHKDFDREIKVWTKIKFEPQNATSETTKDYRVRTSYLEKVHCAGHRTGSCERAQTVTDIIIIINFFKSRLKTTIATIKS